MKKLDSGTVRYSARGFHQDAMDAMRGDIVRALIELITNADDAYAALDDGRTEKRTILVEVEHRKNRPWTVRVRDRATGMTIDDMRSRITDIAQRTSGFESGHARRGNLGRGAKDCAAFGDVTFSSIVEGRLAKLVLQPTGKWRVLTDRNVRKSERSELGVPHSGTTVTIDVATNIRCPRHDTLRSSISSHYQLRDILVPYRVRRRPRPRAAVACGLIEDRRRRDNRGRCLEWRASCRVRHPVCPTGPQTATLRTRPPCAQSAGSDRE